jgi:HEAT repeat protein
MWIAHAAFLFLCQAIWRGTRLPAAARAMVRALASPNPNVRTIAGMFLVRDGLPVERYVKEALARRESLPMALGILGDLGDKAVEPDLRRFAEDQDPQIAQAARNALRVLAANR